MAERLPLVVSTTPLTTAASPLVSPWVQTSDDMSQVVPIFAFTGGSQANTLEGSFDGTNQDTSITYAALTSGTAVTVLHPFIRWRTVQTSANATVTSVYLRAKP